MSQHCLVLGASGFIGTYICDALLAGGHTVFGLDIQVNERRPSENRYRHFASPISADLLQLVLTQNKVDVLVYAAGRASVAASFKSPATDFQENVLTFLEVMDAVRQYSPSTFVVFLSSAAVYGDPMKLPVLETDATNPISPYGFHKLQAEKIADEFRTCFGIHSTVLRVFSCYGEGQRKLLFWDLCERAMGTNELLLKGRGNESRDFIHVTDLANFVLTLIAHKHIAAHVYNVAGGRESSIADVAGLLVKALGVDTRISFEGKANEGNPDNWKADISEMTKLGFTPKMDMEEGIRRYAAWYLSQK